MDKIYTVYLFKTPDCIRGWLAYIDLTWTDSRYDVVVKVDAQNGSQAKSRAITAANNGGVTDYVKSFTPRWNISPTQGGQRRFGRRHGCGRA